MPTMSLSQYPNLSAPLAALHGGLVVSCQALPEEPLFGSDIMARLAFAAKEGGAVGIRANTPADIRAIKAAVPDLPLIGLWKVVVPGRCENVYITPRLHEVAAVIGAGAQIVAIDATRRPHPDGGLSGADFLRAIKAASPDVLILADIATIADSVDAIEAGADAVSTTLSGYTDDSPQQEGPDFALIANLAALSLPVPILAEGRIATPEQARQALDLGAFAVVVGGAITRPQQIARRFAEVLKKT